MVFFVSTDFFGQFLYACVPRIAAVFCVKVSDIDGGQILDDSYIMDRWCDTSNVFAGESKTMRFLFAFL